MEKAFDMNMIGDFVPTLTAYLPVTLYILTLSLLFGFVLGLFLALPRIYNIPIVNQLAKVYISFFRGTPIMVQLFIVFYGIPALTGLIGIDTSKMDPFYAAVATYALSNAAAAAEIIRAGVGSVDKGQTEAAYSIGLSGSQAFRRIVLPQALVQAFPNMGNMVISSLKDTSLAFSIGVMDMSGRGQTLITSSNHSLEVYIALSIVYYAVAVLFEWFFRVAEKRIKKNQTRIVTVFDMNIH
ncbi:MULTISPECIES: sulfur-containing amino acid ABC transporter permease TcyL [Bacillaceae]|jgi:L-cystine transport system permease protein|uniref:L-cystine transport system permease protein TcyL n=5 Tax=Bacillus subtilis TaxID=1423 RepID=TCYL_BACSU|nr:MULTISPECIES: sulfur-containing amino acid ABC transporter permease TcyL [Bacillales]NP_390814.1 sulfur-containing amino acid ABC transporter (permease) [Bacillus subtilis subsp. subtilis str. 168]O34315.1 RecName: Full=L-cystine transport system permease protein TcyL [Bacillus subtilis subsp. subtilis str. 168]MBL3636662.1 sulfur-containing amino acid ABC transporter permease TcyL [Alkalicoccobacillus gibsonii]MBW4824187.1 sulfur-containing amino acid ABC transporter permease TcyL [Bacillac